MSQQFLVLYARITIDKNDGILLNGVYFGGVGLKEEAEAIATDCVNIMRGGTILPKVVPIPDDVDFIELIYDVIDMFTDLVRNMIETQKTINKTKAKKVVSVHHTNCALLNES